MRCAKHSRFHIVMRLQVVMVGVMRRLAANDTGVEVTSVARRDEIGAMAGAVEIFRENAIERIELEHSLQEERQQTAVVIRYVETIS